MWCNAVVASRESQRRKECFDTVADAYEQFRPSPPREVVDAIVELADVHEGSRVLEIDCGTGQLSVPLAELGVDLVAVELGAQLAARAKRNLEQFPHARLDIGAFEHWPLPASTFDVVIAANAFHWLDPQVRLSKSVRALRPGGCLTVLHVHHVRGGTPGFFADTQRSYAKWGMSDDPSFQPPLPSRTPAMYPELEDRPEFSAVRRRYFEIPMQYTTASYVGWLTTDSLVNTLDEPARGGFLRDIGTLIDAK